MARTPDLETERASKNQDVPTRYTIGADKDLGLTSTSSYCTAVIEMLCHPLRYVLPALLTVLAHSLTSIPLRFKGISALACMYGRRTSHESSSLSVNTLAANVSSCTLTREVGCRRDLNGLSGWTRVVNLSLFLQDWKEY